ncbi:MAG: endolytic transglycosylase MltG [Marinilabiliaceae bacterium]|nr:endolytic transglycosylase MltG [Marinilabiliaceae bacterium]
MSIKSNIKRNSKIGKKIIITFFILSLFSMMILLLIIRYQKVIYGTNVNLGDLQEAELYIPSNPTFSEVVDILQFSGYIIDIDNFIWLAERKNYPANVKGGRYILKNNTSNNDLVNMLRGGKQTPVNVIFNNIRTFEELAGVLSKRLEPDSIHFIDSFYEEENFNKYEFFKYNFISMFIPNTYQIYWNTTTEEFIARMFQEYNRFWNETRLELAKNAGLTPLEVSTLASIVDEETVKNDEKPKVAGLYINRLNKGMKLQADPTIKFVLGNFSINRILNRDLLIESPYNTYLYEGLPPGPIRMPSIQGIDAVLNFEKHEYLFMCAKADFSGYHEFAKTASQHNRNAAKYHSELQKRKIFR